MCSHIVLSFQSILLQIFQFYNYGY
jgi:hypothetical protein